MDVYPNGYQEDRWRFVEWHAALIRDPVRRLGYLRRAAGLLPAMGPRRRRRRKLRAAAALVVLLALPLPPGSDVSLPAVREKPVLEESRAAPEVWLVERSEEFETYSNGLRVENTLGVCPSIGLQERQPCC